MQTPPCASGSSDLTQASWHAGQHLCSAAPKGMCPRCVDRVRLQTQARCACRPATAASWACGRRTGGCRWRARSRSRRRSTQVLPATALGSVGPAPVRGAAQLLGTSSNTTGSHGDRTVRCFAARQPAAEMLGAMGVAPSPRSHVRQRRDACTAGDPSADGRPAPPGGFFAKNARVAQDVAGLLLDPRARRATRFARLLIARDAFALADAAATGALHQARGGSGGCRPAACTRCRLPSVRSWTGRHGCTGTGLARPHVTSLFCPACVHHRPWQ